MVSLAGDNPSTSQRLRRHWWALLFLYSGVLLGSYWLLQFTWPSAERWLLLAAGVLAYVLWLVWRWLPANRRSAETELLPAFGPGTQITLLRGLAIALLAGFLFGPWPVGRLGWGLALLYMLVGAADGLDGYVARRSNQATLLGARLDMEFDALGVLVVTLLAISFGQLPWWYLALGLARYLFLFGVWWRQRRALPVYELPPSVHRRILAGSQMGLLSAVLWPIMPAALATIAGTVFAIPSALGFVRDWLAVSGRLDVDGLSYRRLQRRLYRATTRWLPLALRLALGLGLLPVVRSAAWAALFRSWGLPGPTALAGIVAVVTLAALLCVLLGLVPRVASFALVFPIGFDMIVAGPNWANGVAAACTAAVMLLGSGRYSLWQPEMPLIQRRAGEKLNEQPA